MTTRNQRRAFARLLEKLPDVRRYMKSADGAPALLRMLADMVQRKEPRLTHAHEPRILPLKHTRLADLHAHGFNVMPHRAWLRGTLDHTEFSEFFNAHGTLSLRNFREERVGDATPKLPVRYDQRDRESALAFCAEHNARYHTLVNAALPLEESLYAGNIVLPDTDRYLVSYFTGHGTPRDMDDITPARLHVFQREHGSALPHDVPEPLRTLGERFRDFLPHQRPMTVEFSVYPRPIGLHSAPEVFWEWRCGSVHDLYTLVARLLPASSEHDVAIVLPRAQNTRT